MSSSSSSPVPRRRRRRSGEIAGETAAECAAVCCCCPCGLLDLLVFAVVKLPAGLCRRLCMKRRRRRLRGKAALLGEKVGPGHMRVEDEDDVVMEWGIPAAAPSPEVAEMEREMMERFYSTGFWRSPSQREDR